MILYPIFYRKYGVRRIGDLANPKLYSINIFEFPYDSIFHYLGNDVSDYGIRDSEALFKEYHKTIIVDNVIILDDKADKGPPKHNSIQPNTLTRQYFQKNRRMRPLKNIVTTVKDRNVLLIINYAILNHLYRYTHSTFSTYYAWYNLHCTLWCKINTIAQQTNRQQYIYLRLPSVLPPLSSLVIGERGINRNVLQKIYDNESLTILDIWVWLGVHREHSLMYNLEPKYFANVNLVFIESGRWLLINLGNLDTWRQETDSDKELDVAEGLTVHQNGVAITANMLQRRFIRAIICLFESKTAGLDAATLVANEITAKEAKILADNDVCNDDGQNEPILTQRNELPHSKDGSSGEVEEEPVINLKADEVEDLETHQDLAELIKLTDNSNSKSEKEYAEYTVREFKPEHGVIDEADKMAKIGLLSVSEYRRITGLAMKYKTIPSPTGETKTLAEAIIIEPNELKINNSEIVINESIKGVLDPSMLKSSLKQFDSQYIKKILMKDVMHSVVRTQSAGISILSYNIEKVEDIQDEYEIHSVKVAPVIGKPSILRFRLPVVNPDGTFKVGGVKYVYRKQRMDVPIRKIAPDRVALTSYYSKVFIYRSDKKVNSYPDWILNYITSVGLNNDNSLITDLSISECFNPENKAPRIYSILSTRFSKFTLKDMNFSLDWRLRDDFFGAEYLKTITENDLYPIAKTKSDVIVVDYNNTFYKAKGGDLDNITALGSIQELLNMDLTKCPIEIVELGVFSKSIPLGLVLAIHLGLGALLKHLKIVPKIVQSTERAIVNANEFTLKFKDYILILPLDNKQCEFLMGGFIKFHRDLKTFNLKEFDGHDVYGVILDRCGLGSRFINEVDLMFKMFVDHITEEILKEMHEPYDLVNLLLKASKLLETDDSPNSVDLRYMRDRGFERFGGTVYTEIVRAIRSYKAKTVNSNASVDLNPQAIWQVLMQDSAKMPIEDRNPIQNLREKEIVIYNGDGGRSSRSMTEAQRIYHSTALGVTSEATPFTSEAGTIIFSPPDPNYTSVRGLTRRFDFKTDGASKVLSTSALLAPASDKDDGKRLNFINVQNAQNVASVGCTVPPMRTGYERVIGYRVDNNYATIAKDDGKIISIDAEHLKLIYKNGDTESFHIGKLFGRAAGDIVPHLLVSDLKEGQTFKKNTVLSYNSNFFEKDHLDPTQIMMKNSVMATTALIESQDTFEDSCAIGKKLAEKLLTKVIKVRSLKFNFEQQVRNLISAGDAVNLETILCTIADPTAGNTDVWNQGSLDTLKILSNKTPRARAVGYIDKINIYYNGYIDQMSSSLADVVKEYDRKLINLSKKMGTTKITGEVNIGTHIHDQTVDPDSVIIIIYINEDVEMAQADKLVFSNQLKATVSRVLDGVNETTDGRPLDGLFSYQGVHNRIVNSAIVMGTSNTLMILLGQQAVKTYRGK